MCIAHGHGDGRMTKHLLQGQNVPARNDEVTGKRMAKYVSCLPPGKLDRRRVQDTAEMQDTVRERALGLEVVQQRPFKVWINRDATSPTRLAIGEGHNPVFHPFRCEPLNLPKRDPLARQTRAISAKFRSSGKCQSLQQLGYLGMRKER